MWRRAPLGCGLLLVSGLTGLATVAGFLFLIFTQLQGMAAGAQRFTVPGVRTVQIASPGTYTLFHETTSLINGTIHLAPRAPASLQVQVTDATGAPVSVQATTGGSYSVGSYEGQALMDVRFPAAGSYTITVQVAPADGPGPWVMAVNEALGPKILGLVFGGVSLMLIGLTTSAITLVAGIIVLALQRRTAASLPPVR